jgi:hypothetical protein
MISFFLLPKGVLQKLNSIDLDSFGKETARKRSFNWSNGVWSVDPKTKAGLEFTTLRSKTRPCLANGFLSYLPKMVFGRPILRKSILAGVVPGYLETWGFTFLG